MLSAEQEIKTANYDVPFSSLDETGITPVFGNIPKSK